MGEQDEHLCAEERGTIMATTLQGQSARAIADALNCAPSTISRERRRNGWKREAERRPIGRPAIAGGDEARRAGRRAARLRRKPRRPRKLTRDSALWREVRRLLGHYFSPAQIAGTRKRLHPGAPAMHASHETIYTAIYAPKGELRRGRMKDLLRIHVRPPEASERLLPGHWEGDFLKGAAGRSAIGTLIDRKTLFVMLVKMKGCDAKAALEGFRDAFSSIDPRLRKTLTYDQGKAMALHRALAESTGLTIYFADPIAPGSGASWRTRTGYCVSISQRARTSRATLSVSAIAGVRKPSVLRERVLSAQAMRFFEHCFNERLNLGLNVALGS